MRALIVASLIAVLLTLFVATTTDAPHDASETQVVAIEAEYLCADACMHTAIANVPHYGTEAECESRVLKFPSETAGSTGYAKVRTLIGSIHSTVVIGTMLKLPNYSGLRAATSPKVEVLNVGARA